MTNSADSVKAFNSVVLIPAGERSYKVQITTNPQFVEGTILLAQFLQEHYSELDIHILNVHPDKLGELHKNLARIQFENPHSVQFIITPEWFWNISSMYGYYAAYKDPVLKDLYQNNPSLLENRQCMEKWSDKVGREQLPILKGEHV